MIMQRPDQDIVVTDARAAFHSLSAQCFIPALLSAAPALFSLKKWTDGHSFILTIIVMIVG